MQALGDEIVRHTPGLNPSTNFRYLTQAAMFAYAADQLQTLFAEQFAGRTETQIDNILSSVALRIVWFGSPSSTRGSCCCVAYANPMTGYLEDVVLEAPDGSAKASVLLDARCACGMVMGCRPTDGRDFSAAIAKRFVRCTRVVSRGVTVYKGLALKPAHAKSAVLRGADGDRTG